jgi:denticleless
VSLFLSGEDVRLELLTPVRRWHAHRDAIFDICWTMEDRRLLTGSGDYSVCYWDTETMALVSTFRGHTGSVKVFLFDLLLFFQNNNSPHQALRCHNYDFNVFASAGRDGTILVWDVRVQEKSNNFGVAVKHPALALQNVHAMRRPGAAGRRTPSSSVGGLPAPDADRGLSGAKSVTGLAFALDDTMLVSSGADGRIKYWDVRKVSFTTPVGVADPRPVVCLDVKPPPPQPSVGAAVNADVSLSSRPHGITCIALNRFGSRLAVYSLDNHIYEFDFFAPEDTASMRCFDSPVTSFFAKMAYSPDATHLAAGSAGMHVSVFDVRSGGRAGPTRRLEGHTASVLAVDWSGLGSAPAIASCSDDGTTRLWTLQPNRPQIRRPAPTVEAAQAADLRQATTGATAVAVAAAAAAPTTARPVRPPLQPQILAYFKPRQ